MADPNLVTAAKAILPSSGDAYPQLSPAQEAALDGDNDGKPGGSKPRKKPDAADPVLEAAVAELTGAAGGGAGGEVTFVAAGGDAAPGQVVRKGSPVDAASEPTSSLVVVRITKAGDGKVHTGADAPEKQTYDWNDEVVLPREVSLALEERGLAEIQRGA